MENINLIRVKTTKPMTLHRHNQVPFLTFPDIEALRMVKHGFSMRDGGVSSGYLKSMNLSFSRGDKEENVIENFKRITGALEISFENMVFSDQTHKTQIKRVIENDKGKGISKPLDYHDIDGLITNIPNIPLVTFYADCVPLFFVDPVNKAIGLSHSGWRGTAMKMGKKTVEAMTREFNTRPEDLICGIGPSICSSCYEVSEDVTEEFFQNFQKIDTSVFLKEKKEKPSKYLLDLWKANEEVLKEAGVNKKNIHTTDICTACNHELMFSHRASGGKRGNLAAFISL